MKSIKINLKKILGQHKLLPNEKLLEIIKDLDEELEKNKATMDKRLVHYLGKRSYQKALEFVEEKEKI